MVSAQTGQGTILETPVSLGWISQVFGLVDPTTWGEFLIVLTIFLMFFVAFSDIIQGFTAFSKPAAWTIGFGLAVIGALTKGCLIVAKFLLTITVWAGTFSMVVALITGFFAFALIHLGITSMFRWVLRRKVMIQAMKSAEEPGEAWGKLKEFQRITR
ncbi:MAG: hypothetical protein N3G19_00925 [Candidatus Pacearchaeota archaeon]|nr:hypothetical protein [Candidatus Pacearchaeota archaeon]